MITLQGGYTFAPFFGQADFPLRENPDFVRVRTKSACPTATEKCLPATNLLLPGALLAPIGNPESKGLRPSEHALLIGRLT